MFPKFDKALGARYHYREIPVAVGYRKEVMVMADRRAGGRVPHVPSKGGAQPRARNKDGAWRRKRSDAGKPRAK